MPKHDGLPPSASTIRVASTRDIDQIMAIDRQVYSTPWSQRMMLHQVLEPGRVHVVASRPGWGVVGHAGVLFMVDGAHVSTIAVDPTHRRNGIGHDMLLALFRASIAKGPTAVTLEVRASNEAAMGLYRRFGMAPVGVRRGYYTDTGEDALVLWSPELEGDYLNRILSMSYHETMIVDDEVAAWERTGVRT